MREIVRRCRAGRWRLSEDLPDIDQETHQYGKKQNDGRGTTHGWLFSLGNGRPLASVVKNASSRFRVGRFRGERGRSAAVPSLSTPAITGQLAKKPVLLAADRKSARPPLWAQPRDPGSLAPFPLGMCLSPDMP